MEQKRVKIYSALEVAAMLGVVNQTPVNWIKSGHLKAFTTPAGEYRIHAEDILSFLSARSMRIPGELDTSVRVKLDSDLILVADADKNLGAILTRMLERRLHGIRVIQALDGFEASTLATEQHPFLVLLDLNFPGVDGRMLCRRLRNDPFFGKPFVLAITDITRPEIRSLILGEGAEDYFTKPLDFEALLAKAQELRAATVGEAGRNSHDHSQRRGDHRAGP